MKQPYIKKLGEILEEEGLKVHDHTFVTIMEDEIRRLGEELEKEEYEFHIEREFDDVIVIIHGEVIEHYGKEEYLISSNKYECIEFKRKGKAPYFVAFDYIG